LKSDTASRRALRRAVGIKAGHAPSRQPSIIGYSVSRQVLGHLLGVELEQGSGTSAALWSPARRRAHLLRVTVVAICVLAVIVSMSTLFQRIIQNSTTNSSEHSRVSSTTVSRVISSTHGIEPYALKAIDDGDTVRLSWSLGSLSANELVVIQNSAEWPYPPPTYLSADSTYVTLKVAPSKRYCFAVGATFIVITKGMKVPFTAWSAMLCIRGAH
jgi:hypothetical protein